MKNIFSFIALAAFICCLSSCEKDEGKLPNLAFKSGGSYISSDQSLAKGASYTIGITASKAEKKDVLKKFNISKSVNGGTAATVFDKDLSGSEEDDYSYDYTATMDTVSGTVVKLTFSVTNRDGLVNQLTRTLTVL